MKQTIEIEVDVPFEVERKAEFRTGVRKGSDMLNPFTGEYQVAGDDSWKTYSTIVLTRKEPLAIQACRKVLEAKSCLAGGGETCHKLGSAHDYATRAIAEHERKG